jgi:long-chain acyl-CoA synthetase
MNVAEWLNAGARVRPSAPALLRGTTEVADYAGFARRAGAVAATLRDEYGVRPGDRVALFMQNRTEYLECLYGVLWAGAVVVPVNCKLNTSEMAWIVENAEAVLTISSELDALFAGPALPEPIPRGPTTSRGSSTPRARRGGPKARCSRTPT